MVRVRETRLTTFFSHILIGLSMFMIPEPLQYIPTAVLYGLFLYMAFTALDGNQLFERIMLLVTEQVSRVQSASKVLYSFQLYSVNNSAIWLNKKKILCLKACDRLEDLTLNAVCFNTSSPPPPSFQQMCQIWVGHNLLGPI